LGTVIVSQRGSSRNKGRRPAAGLVAFSVYRDNLHTHPNREGRFMSTATAATPDTYSPDVLTNGDTLTIADLLQRFGPMRLKRIRFNPWPGTATEQDVLDILVKEDRLFELMDGILVEKAMGFPEAFLAAALIRILGNWVSPRKLGAVAAPDGMMRLAAGLVRIPDVSFIRWDRFPNRQVQPDPIPNLSPDLAVEVLSPSNTDAEMGQKLRDYFGSGTQLVWFVDPRQRTVTIYTAPDESVVLREDQTLDGGAVLPGFTLPLRELFAELDPH
jgi:Uma2 family endonuclease